MSIKYMLYCRFLTFVHLNLFSNVRQECRYLNAYVLLTSVAGKLLDRVDQ